MGDWIKCSDRLPEQGERVLGAWGKMVGEAYLNYNVPIKLDTKLQKDN